MHLLPPVITHLLLTLGLTASALGAEWARPTIIDVAADQEEVLMLIQKAVSLHEYSVTPAPPQLQ
jgi:hypothetical protein